MQRAAARNTITKGDIMNKPTIEIKLTWRIWFYLGFLLVVGSLVSNAIYYHYENKFFALALWIAYTGSYLLSIFLLHRKEE